MHIQVGVWKQVLLDGPGCPVLLKVLRKKIGAGEQCLLLGDSFYCLHPRQHLFPLQCRQSHKVKRTFISIFANHLNYLQRLKLEFENNFNRNHSDKMMKSARAVSIVILRSPLRPDRNQGSFWPSWHCLQTLWAPQAICGRRYILLFEDVDSLSLCSSMLILIFEFSKWQGQT